MQQHSVEHRTFHYVPSCRSLVPSDGLENAPLRTSEHSLVGDQEWDTNRDINVAQHLRRPWFLDRQSPSQGRLCIFPHGAAHSLAGVFVLEEIGQAAHICEFCCVSTIEAIAGRWHFVQTFQIVPLS